MPPVDATVSLPVTEPADLTLDSHRLVGDPPEVRSLVASARTGDRAAFDRLVSLYHRVVFRTALAALQRREDAEDAAQDAFVLAWRKIHSFRGDSSFKTWLLTITWRQALGRRKSRARWWQRGTTPQTDTGFSQLDHLVSLEPDPERLAEARQRAHHVRDAINALSPTLRDTLLLVASGDHGYAEIAGMLGVPLGTVKWRVAEARRIIQGRLP